MAIIRHSYFNTITSLFSLFERAMAVIFTMCQSAVLALFVMIDAQILSCCSDWTLYDKHCYRFFKQNISYTMARDACLRLDSHLASSKNSKENSMLNLLADIYGGGDLLRSVWIGGSDLVKENVYMWDDGSYVDWFNWQRGEPNKATRGENCIILVRGGFWMDAPCLWNIYYICKSKAQLLPTWLGCRTVLDLRASSSQVDMTCSYTSRYISYTQFDDFIVTLRDSQTSPPRVYNCSDANCSQPGITMIRNGSSALSISFPLPVNATRGHEWSCTRKPTALFDCGAKCYYEITKAPETFNCSVQWGLMRIDAVFACNAHDFVSTDPSQEVQCEWKEDGPTGTLTIVTPLHYNNGSDFPRKGNCQYERPRFTVDGNYNFSVTLKPWRLQHVFKTLENVIDDCFPEPCQNRAPCTDLIHDFYCACVFSFSGKKCEKVHPFEPTVDCSEYVIEFCDVTCTCRSTVDVRNATPAVMLAWDPIDTENTSTYLRLYNVSRNHEPKVYTCRQTWSFDLSSKTVTYRLQVVYGPTRVNISGPHLFESDGNSRLDLTCEADDANPPPDFTWLNVVCTNGNSEANCSWVPDVLRDTGKVITCEASNRIMVSMTARGNYTLWMKWTGKPIMRTLTINTDKWLKDDVSENVDFVTLDRGTPGVILHCAASGDPLPFTVVRQEGADSQELTAFHIAISFPVTLIYSYYIAKDDEALECGPPSPGCDVRSYVCNASNSKGSIQKRVALRTAGCLCGAVQGQDEDLPTMIIRTAGPIFLIVFMASLVILASMSIRKKLRKALKKRQAGVAVDGKSTLLERVLDFMMKRMPQATINKILRVKQDEPDSGSRLSYHSSEDTVLKEIQDLSITMAKLVKPNVTATHTNTCAATQSATSQESIGENHTADFADTGSESGICSTASDVEESGNYTDETKSDSSS